MHKMEGLHFTLQQCNFAEEEGINLYSLEKL